MFIPQSVGNVAIHRWRTLNVVCNGIANLHSPHIDTQVNLHVCEQNGRPINPSFKVTMYSQKAVSAYLKNKQIIPFGFARQKGSFSKTLLTPMPAQFICIHQVVLIPYYICATRAMLSGYPVISLMVHSGPLLPSQQTNNVIQMFCVCLVTRETKSCGIHVLHLHYSGKALCQHFLRHWYVVGLQYWHMSDNDDDTKTDNRPHCDMIEVVWQALREKVSDTACGSMSVVVSGCESETDCREISQSAISRKKRLEGPQTPLLCEDKQQ